MEGRERREGGGGRGARARETRTPAPLTCFCSLPSAALVPAGKKGAAPPVKPDTSKFRPLDPAQVAFFASRGISKETLDRNGVCGADAYFAPLGGMAPAVAFPYKRDGEVVNVKFRSEKKHFTQVRGAEKVLYGLDDVVGQADIIIVEGEMDKLALEEAGATARKKKRGGGRGGGRAPGGRTRAARPGDTGFEGGPCRPRHHRRWVR